VETEYYAVIFTLFLRLQLWAGWWGLRKARGCGNRGLGIYKSSREIGRLELKDERISSGGVRELLGISGRCVGIVLSWHR
jgi:hypothetical protein